MKVTNKTIIESLEAAQALSKLSLPIKLSFSLGKSLRKIQAALEDYNAERLKIVTANAKKLKDGKPVPNATGNIDLKNAAAYAQDMEELNSIELELDITPIPLSALGDIEFPAQYFLALDWLIVADC